MKTILLLDTVEHRFVHSTAETPEPFNDVAAAGARQIASAPIPETDLVGSVWKLPVGSEMTVPDRDADKLISLGYAKEV